MMTDFKVHTIDSAPDASKPTLEKAQKGLGFVPNLYGVFAESPAMLEAYATLGGIFDRSTSFTATSASPRSWPPTTFGSTRLRLA